MNKINRRKFVGGLATSSLLLWLPKLQAQQSTPLVRYDIASDAGQQMLDIYAYAVGRMTQIPVGDPRSWLWQWYTHAVDGRTTKNAEMERILGFNPPLRQLAQDMWNTCPHQGGDPFYFLPWHRMYVYFFEEIVRFVSGVPSFTLPYWNYTSPDPSKRGIVPVQFRSPRAFIMLYRQNRNPVANSNFPITTGQQGDLMGIRNIMSTASYSDSGFIQGVGTRIDTGIHGFIHTLVGTETNMGNVPYAASDPLFWVHHANIDRMWASWNAAGRSNPTGTQQGLTQFVFADQTGARRLGQVSDYLATEQLGYTYDTLMAVDGTEIRPTFNGQMLTRSRRSVAADAADNSTPSVIARSSEAVTIEAKPVQVSLVPSQRSSMETDPSQRYFLVLRDLRAPSPPGVVYHIHLTHGIAPPEENNYVGSVTFFGAGSSGQGSHAGATQSMLKPLYSFDVTDVMSAIKDQGPLELIMVTIVPNGTPASRAAIGAIELGTQ